MKNAAIIPARGGSKRLPRKNILSFNGNPLIFYTLWFAQKSAIIDKVIVSTDDLEIANLCKDFSVEVIMRPAELATDHATTSSVIAHVLSVLDGRKEYYDFITTLQVTNPLREQYLLEEPLQKIMDTPEASSIISVSPMNQKYGLINSDGYFEPENYAFELRSQDLKKRYAEDGYFYLTRAEVVRKTGSLFGDSSLAHISNDQISRIDIDNAEDFAIAEALFNQQSHKFQYLL